MYNRNAPGSQDAHELRNVPADQVGGYVLQDQAAIDKVEVIVRKQSEVVLRIYRIDAAVTVLVECARLFDHRRCYIKAFATSKAPCQRLCEPTDCAAKIQAVGSGLGQTKCFEPSHQLVYLFAASGEKSIAIPEATPGFRLCENGPQWVVFAPPFPRSL
jgi:hypothetical protein